MRLTYLELLEAVKEGKQPKKVKVGSVVYSWDGCEYVQNADSRQTLSDRLPNWTTKGQTSADFIEEVVDILTGEEREFLKAVIKPIRERVLTFEKSFCGQIIIVIIRYKVGDFVHVSSIPVAKLLDNAYEGMEVCRKYTLEELDL